MRRSLTRRRTSEGRDADRETIDRFLRLYYEQGVEGRTWRDTYWLGTRALKCVADLFVYQEILTELRPGLIVETGTAEGGSAVFLASICDLLGHGNVVTIDIAPQRRPPHPRITYLTGSSTSDDVVAEVRSRAAREHAVVVILDSDHTKDHVLRELEVYADLVTPGSYLIVEDTSVNGHPVLPEFGPGPMEAVEEFLARDDRFVIDPRREKFLVTFNPHGFLRRRGADDVAMGPAGPVPRATTDPIATPPAHETFRAWIGPPERYDQIAAAQFALLTQLGLRETHSLLDVGCGALRAGKLFIPYLLPGRYFGIEPNRWLVDEGIERELGRGIVDAKRPTFSDVSDFRLTVFDRAFDFILAHSILTHTSRAQMQRVLDEARAALAPGGAFVATFLEGEVDNEDQEWVYPDVVRYRRETLEGAASAAGLDLTVLDWPHADDQTWCVLTRSEDRVERHGDPRLERAAELGHVGLLDQYERMKAMLNDSERARAEAEQTLVRIARHPAVRAYSAVKRLVRRRGRSS